MSAPERRKTNTDKSDGHIVGNNKSSSNNNSMWHRHLAILFTSLYIYFFSFCLYCWSPPIENVANWRFIYYYCSISFGCLISRAQLVYCWHRKRLLCLICTCVNLIAVLIIYVLIEKDEWHKYFLNYFTHLFPFSAISIVCIAQSRIIGVVRGAYSQLWGTVCSLHAARKYDRRFGTPAIVWFTAWN